MAKAPKGLSVRMESLGESPPEWSISMVEQFNTFSSQVNECLEHGVSRGENLDAGEKEGLVFTTEATAADTFPIPVSHGLPRNARHAVCTKIERADGAVITNPWSMTWRSGSTGQILVTFQGLSNSTKYRVNMTFE